MGVLDKPTNARAGLIMLDVQSLPGQTPAGDFYVQLVDRTTGETVGEKRGLILNLPNALKTALQTQPLPTALNTIRTTIDAELA